MNKIRCLIALCALAPSLALADTPSNAELAERVQLLERRLESSALVEMSNQMEALRQEVQNLRGELDRVTRQLKQLQDRQRDLYKDVDSRLQELEQRPAQQQQPTGGQPQDGAGQEGGDGEPQGGATGGGNGEGADPETVYRDAFETLKAGRYAEAGKAFQAFLDSHPDSQYADNALYWLGESHYVVREFKPALEHFQRLLDEFPESAKRPDALLKIGFIHYEEDRVAQAKETLIQVRERYPDSSASSLAQQRLDRIRAEGR